MVLAIVQDRPLEPVARISTAATSPCCTGPAGPLAEFCDDRVTACRLIDGGAGDEQHWREWELELVDGSVPGAGSCSTGSPAGCSTPARHRPGTRRNWRRCSGPWFQRLPTAGRSVHRAVAEQVAALLHWDRAVRTDSDDAVHQMRVTIRQIRSLLQASEEEFGLTDDATIPSELRELAAVLGSPGMPKFSPSVTATPSTRCRRKPYAGRCRSVWSTVDGSATKPA